MVQTPARNHAQRGNHKHYARMTHPNPHRHVVPIAVLTRSKLVPLTAASAVTVDVPHNNVIRPRPTKTVSYKPHSPQRRTINHRPLPPASNFPPKVTTVKAPNGNPHHALKDKGVIDSGCSRHMTVNMSYLTDFEEINGRYVAFGGNPKGGKISGKGKIRTVTTVVPPNNVTRPRPANTFVTKPHSPPRRNINHRPSPKPSTFTSKVTTVKAPKVNAVKGVQGNWDGSLNHALKDKRVIDSGCSRHITWNMSYLSDFEEINGGYVAFGGNPKGGKITGKGKIRT
nr:hypothetical protein [Tanacetum cinerariifolium]